jgi:hypothetical protein
MNGMVYDPFSERCGNRLFDYGPLLGVATRGFHGAVCAAVPGGGVEVCAALRIFFVYCTNSTRQNLIVTNDTFLLQSPR